MEEAESHLAERLRRRISDDGPITFAEFMDTALYDPVEGFYSQPPIGVTRHYVTSPHVSGAFADLLVRQLVACWESLGHVSPFTVVEAGAGDGALAGQILASGEWSGEARDSLQYFGVDRSAGAREALRSRGIEGRASLADLAPITGVVFANELLDNLPFHRLANRDGNLVELMVSVDGDEGTFVLVDGPVSPEAQLSLRRAPAEGAERPVSPATEAFVADVARVVRRGYVFLFDYGFGAGDSPQSTRSYLDQGVTTDVMSRPGGRDISTGVDFDALSDAARERGFDVWGPASQRDALMRLGFREWLAKLRDRQLAAEGAGEWRRAVNLFGERSRAPMLVDEAQLGSLQLVVFGRDVARPLGVAENP
ncbi:MAG: SAM-dependent methyltransferase [Actinomycetota bacterium]|nr:SAM-dependent methyltransferase [Actinomycetota bacterium]